MNHDADAAIAEAQRMLSASRRPRCWHCGERMDRAVSGRYYHCTIPGCRASLLSVGATPPWEYHDDEEASP
jgi:hypothetical protein